MNQIKKTKAKHHWNHKTKSANNQNNQIPQINSFPLYSSLFLAFLSYQTHPKFNATPICTYKHNTSKIYTTNSAKTHHLIANTTPLTRSWLTLSFSFFQKTPKNKTKGTRFKIKHFIFSFQLFNFPWFSKQPNVMWK